MKKGLKPRELALLGLLTAVLLVMSYTPLGSLPVGPLSASLKMIPVAIGAAALGSVSGAILGSVFGLTSFLQCFGIGFAPSALVLAVFEVNPYLTFILCVVPRALAGLLTGAVYRLLKKYAGKNRLVREASPYLTGFCAAFFNTLLFMSALVLLFGSTTYMQEQIAGRSVLVYVCATVGVNAVFEMAVCTLVTGLLCKALEKAKLLEG